MTLRQLVALIIIATLLLWAGWGWTLFTIDPQATNLLGFLFFYAIFFLAMTGSMAVLGLALRQKRGTDLPLYHLVAITFRQGLLLSALLTALLILQGLRRLSLPALGALFIVVLAAELFLALRFAKQARARIAKQKPEVPGLIAASTPGPTFVKRELGEDLEE